MNQVGQLLSLNVSSSQDAVAYVWRFWDGTTKTTYEPSIQKVLNKGGILTWYCDAINEFGSKTTVSDVVTVNDPPVIEVATLSVNDLPPTFSTTLSVTVTDPDSTDPLTVGLSGHPDQVISSIVSGKTHGSVDFIVSVSTDQTKTLTVTDADGGITTLDVDFRTSEVSAILVSIVSEPRSVRVGPSSTIEFTARITDPNFGGTPTVLWSFYESDGWILSDFQSNPDFSPIFDGPSVVGYSSSGTIQTLDLGSYRALLLLNNFSTQVGGTKVVEFTASPVIGQVRSVRYSIDLLGNQAPTIRRFNIISPELVVPGQEVVLEVDAVDPDGDYLSYSWDITSPIINTLSTNLPYNPVSLIPVGGTISGDVEVTDSFGALAVASIPPLIVSSRLDLDGTVSVPFIYVPRSMASGPVNYKFGDLPLGLTYAGGTLVGVPLIAGVVDTTLTAEDSHGNSDERALHFTIVTMPNAPLSPSNLRVNGDGTNPRYSSGQDVVIQWTVTSDSEKVSGSQVELRTVAGDLKLTFTLAEGRDILTITPAQILGAYGSLQDLVIRVYAYRDGLRSVFPAETRVDYV